MRLLLDTRAYLWWLTDDPKLSDRARDVVASPHTVVHVSAASLWEIGVKADLGRLDLGDADLVAEIEACGFIELPLSARHIATAAALPPHHDDPFERLLVAQALLDHLTLATTGSELSAYGASLFETHALPA